MKNIFLVLILLIIPFSMVSLISCGTDLSDPLSSSDSSDDDNKYGHHDGDDDDDRDRDRDRDRDDGDRCRDGDNNNDDDGYNDNDGYNDDSNDGDNNNDDCNTDNVNNDNNDGSTNTGNTGTLTLSSGSLINNNALPQEFTCDGTGGGYNPDLTWSNLPQGTYNLAFIMYSANGDVIWGVYNIPNSRTEIPKNIGTLPEPIYTQNYESPCPPTGNTVNYEIILYAMNQSMQRIETDISNKTDFTTSYGSNILASSSLHVSVTR